MKKLGVVIPAGGNGTRMGSDGIPKQFLPLAGEPVLAHSIRAFRSVASEADIVVALPADHFETWTKLCREHDIPPHKVCEGGASRFASVRGALQKLDPECEYIAVHDGARPLASPELILRAVETAHTHGTAIPVIPLTDTVRRITDEDGTSHAEDRTSLRAVQTPQVFRADILLTAYGRAVGDDFTDDGSVVEAVGYSLMLCEGERRNIKITEPADLTIAESLLG